MVEWKLTYSKQAQKYSLKAQSSNLKPKIEEILAIIQQDPFATPPSHEKLIGDLDGLYSRRINR